MCGKFPLLFMWVRMTSRAVGSQTTDFQKAWLWLYSQTARASHSTIAWWHAILCTHDILSILPYIRYLFNWSLTDSKVTIPPARQISSQNCFLKSASSIRLAPWWWCISLVMVQSYGFPWQLLLKHPPVLELFFSHCSSKVHRERMIQYYASY